MSARNPSSTAQAAHCRELAEWTDDARTQHILLEMARELEEADAKPSPGQAASAPVPRSLS